MVWPLWNGRLNRHTPCRQHQARNSSSSGALSITFPATKTTDGGKPAGWPTINNEPTWQCDDSLQQQRFANKSLIISRKLETPCHVIATPWFCYFLQSRETNFIFKPTAEAFQGVGCENSSLAFEIEQVNCRKQLPATAMCDMHVIDVSAMCIVSSILQLLQQSQWRPGTSSNLENYLF